MSSLLPGVTERGVCFEKRHLHLRSPKTLSWMAERSPGVPEHQKSPPGGGFRALATGGEPGVLIQMCHLGSSEVAIPIRTGWAVVCTLEAFMGYPEAGFRGKDYSSGHRAKVHDSSSTPTPPPICCIFSSFASISPRLKVAGEDPVNSPD